MAHAHASDHSPHGAGPGAGHGAGHGAHHGPSHYVKIWVVLCVLLVVSIVGPMIGIKLLTLLTAFGIAVVKAWMVAAYFMHLKIERKFATLVLVAMMGAILVFWYGIAPDVQKHEGVNWENRATREHIEKSLAAQAAAGGEHGDHAAPAPGHDNDLGTADDGPPDGPDAHDAPHGQAAPATAGTAGDRH